MKRIHVGWDTWTVITRA